jgi:UDP-N-acetylenolpyruvoylglucosamine reductase
MNAGTRDVEIADVLESVTVWDAARAEEKILPRTAIQFGYRSSSINGELLPRTRARLSRRFRQTISTFVSKPRRSPEETRISYRMARCL